MKEIGHRLSQIRKDLGYTQKEMADYLQVSNAALQSYEYGKIPKGEVLKKLSDLGYDLNWLFTGDGKMMVAYPNPEKKIAWNVAYFLSKRIELPYEPSQFADTFMDIHDWMATNSQKNEDERKSPEVTAEVIDFALQRMVSK